VKLQLKFREDASQAQREQVVQALANEEGAGDVRPLFPDATDPMRSALYVVDADDHSEGPLLSFLERADAVEFAEPEVRRKLAGP